MTENLAAEKIIVYGNAFCPQVGPVKSMLAQSDVPFEYVDIRQDVEAAANVRHINNGNESVPTLVFPDGSTLTEPDAGELKAKLESLGYSVGWLAWLTGNIWRIAILAFVLFAVLRIFELI